MANTTNLNLAKPAGTDKALVSVLNSNSDKIDAWAGTTNQALAKLGSAPTRYTGNDSLTTLESNISSFVNSLSNGTIGVCVMAITAYFSVFSGGDWIFTIYKTDNRFFSGTASSYNNAHALAYFQYFDGTWTFDELARKSDLNGSNEIYGSSVSVNSAKLGSFQCVYTSALDTPGDKGIVYTGGVDGGTEKWQLFIGSNGIYRRHFVSNAWTAWTTV